MKLEIKETRFYRVDEMAAIFSVSERSIRNWANDPDINFPAYRLGDKRRGILRCLGKDVLAWLDGCKVKPWE